MSDSNKQAEADMAKAELAEAKPRLGFWCCGRNGEFRVETTEGEKRKNIFVCEEKGGLREIYSLLKKHSDPPSFGYIREHEFLKPSFPFGIGDKPVSFTYEGGREVLIVCPGTSAAEDGYWGWGKLSRPVPETGTEDQLPSMSYKTLTIGIPSWKLKRDYIVSRWVDEPWERETIDYIEEHRVGIY